VQLGILHRLAVKLRSSNYRHQSITVDVGLETFATLSNGQCSANRNKARLKVAKTHAKITDIRNDFLHQLTTKLIHENQVIKIETLNIKGMMQNHKLAKADASWAKFFQYLEYKATWYGRKLFAQSQWLSSSKTFSDCGYVNKSMPLKVRKWTCQECHSTHDRDINAAKNINTTIPTDCRESTSVETA
jgi:IS605 OrfB family transposase